LLLILSHVATVLNEKVSSAVVA